jgi:hypothetical protein
MTKRGRYISLGIFAVIGMVLAWGAWHKSPGKDADNQGGYAIVLLFFLILLFIYVPVLMRSIAARLRRRPVSDARPPGDA